MGSQGGDGLFPAELPLVSTDKPSTSSMASDATTSGTALAIGASQPPVQEREGSPLLDTEMDCGANDLGATNQGTPRSGEGSEQLPPQAQKSDDMEIDEDAQRLPAALPAATPTTPTTGQLVPGAGHTPDDISAEAQTNVAGGDGTVWQDEVETPARQGDADPRPLVVKSDHEITRVDDGREYCSSWTHHGSYQLTLV